ncbi:PREDICTED: tyrosine-protein phosphatase non-receptor type substrate 1-like [Nanorana parkeri]|uniref:tyrosine-protein phosphatase non-receptor type substrate 1-like n=1 Tax=Nanorana parkeri TaxID=125878 RepID=UPI00085416F7|nr:PREDICTED: tyrosine-protein phosphatase non-receptor type substrate 1-like [Nanorana parkeri]
MEPLLSAEDITGHASHSVTKSGRVFNMTSELSYTPSVRDHGAKMVCEVKHKAFRGLRRLEKHINVVARPNKMYITSSPLVPRAGEKLALSCIVEKFYPKPIEVSWVKNREALTGVTQYGPFPRDNDYYSVWNQIEFVLSEKDDGAIFICQITHNSLGSPAEVSYEINLKGMPPEVQYISADPPDPGVGAETRLSCMIQNFFPMDIEVVWLRNGVQQDFGVFNSPCVQSSRGLYSMCAMLKFIAQAGDHESVFTCRVQHVALKSCQERTYTLTLSGSSASSSNGS